MVGPRTMSGGASAGSVYEVLRPRCVDRGQWIPTGICTTMSTGVCFCTKCTRVCINSVQMAQAWAGGLTVEEVEASAHAGTEVLGQTVQSRQLALTTVTINDGGVGAVLTMGTIGRSVDGVWFKPCRRCGGLAFSSTHPHAFRWSCTDCGFTNVFARWRIGTGDSVPPVWSCSWPEHAVMVKGDEGQVDIVFDTRRVLRVPMALAMVLRDFCMEWGLVSETAMAFASIVWCATRLEARSGRRFAESAIEASSGIAVAIEVPEGGWIIDDRTVVYEEE